MTKKIGDKKIHGVKSTQETSGVKGAEVVGGVAGVKAATGVGGVKGAGAIRKRQSTRTMTVEEREELFKMINEEAEAMFGRSGMPQAQRELVQNAVKMAVDAGLLDEDDEDEPVE